MTERINPWYNEDCKEKKIEMRKALKEFRKWGTKDKREDYIEKRQKYKDKMDEERQMYYERFAKELNDCRDSKAFWKSVNLLKGGKKANEIYVEAEKMAKEFKKGLYDQKQQSTKRLSTDLKNEDLDKKYQKLK